MPFSREAETLYAGRIHFAWVDRNEGSPQKSGFCGERLIPYRTNPFCNVRDSRSAYDGVWLQP